MPNSTSSSDSEPDFVYKKSKYFAYVRFLDRSKCLAYEFRVINACFVYDFFPESDKDFDIAQEYYIKYFCEEEEDEDEAEYDVSTYYRGQIIFMSEDEKEVINVMKKSQADAGSKRQVYHKVVSPWPKDPPRKGVPHPTGPTSKCVEKAKTLVRGENECNKNSGAEKRVIDSRNARKEAKAFEEKSIKGGISSALDSIKEAQPSDVPTLTAVEIEKCKSEFNTLQLKHIKLVEHSKLLELENNNFRTRMQKLEADLQFYKSRCLKWEDKYEKLESELKEQQTMKQKYQDKVLMLLEEKAATSSRIPMGSAKLLAQKEITGDNKSGKMKKDTKGKNDTFQQTNHSMSPSPELRTNDAAPFFDNGPTSDGGEDDGGEDIGSQWANTTHLDSDSDNNERDSPLGVTKSGNKRRRIDSSSSEPGETPVGDTVNAVTQPNNYQQQTEEQPQAAAVNATDSDDDVHTSQEAAVNKTASNKKKLAKMAKFSISKKMAWVVTSDEDEDDATVYPQMFERKPDESGNCLDVHIGKNVWIPKTNWSTSKKLPETHDSTWFRQICIGMKGDKVRDFTFLGKTSKNKVTKPGLPVNERRALKALYKERLFARNKSLKGTRECYMYIKNLSGWYGSLCSDKNKGNNKK